MMSSLKSPWRWKTPQTLWCQWTPPVWSCGMSPRLQNCTSVSSLKAANSTGLPTTMVVKTPFLVSSCDWTLSSSHSHITVCASVKWLFCVKCWFTRSSAKGILFFYLAMTCWCQNFAKLCYFEGSALSIRTEIITTSSGTLILSQICYSSLKFFTYSITIDEVKGFKTSYTL